MASAKHETHEHECQPGRDSIGHLQGPPPCQTSASNIESRLQCKTHPGAIPYPANEETGSDTSQQNVIPSTSDTPRTNEVPSRLHPDNSGSENIGRPETYHESTWASGQRLVHVVSAQSLSNPTNKLVAISTITACIISIMTLGVTIWQAMVQQSQNQGSSESSDDKKDGWRADPPSPDTEQRDEQHHEDVPSYLNKVYIAAIACIGVVACLALAFSVYSAIALSRRRQQDRRPSDPAVSAVAEFGRHARFHAHRAHQYASSYRVTLEQITLGHWRFWAAPYQELKVTDSDTEVESTENGSIVSPDSTRFGSGDEDDYFSSWEGDIRTASEDERSESISPEDFKLTDTHVSARSAIDLGEEELRRRYHDHEKLLRREEEEDAEDLKRTDTHVSARSVINLGEEELKWRYHEHERLLRRKEDDS